MQKTIDETTLKSKKVAELRELPVKPSGSRV